ncbi:MAG: autotransporter outer membrane beta-barrel domain-containing protein, partial [Xanthobacteraceae bacterium]
MGCGAAFWPSAGMTNCGLLNIDNITFIPQAWVLLRRHGRSGKRPETPPRRRKRFHAADSWVINWAPEACVSVPRDRCMAGRATGVAMGRIGIGKNALLGGSAVMLVLSASSGALAQNCTQLASPIGNLDPFVGFAVSAATSIAGSIGNVNTAFLTQQGSAFVANPAATAPGQQAGGVWVRGVGGEVEIKTTSTANAAFNVAPPGDIFSVSGNVTCTSRERDTFGGVQVGSDIARLDLAGWNVNVGTTAGYLESRSRELNGGGTRTNFEVPFIGAYVVVTRGGFFADLTVRGEFYNMELNNPAINFFNQPFSAHGVSVSASAGYNMPFGAWFIEPSAGFIWSRTKVDPFSAVGLPGGLDFSGTVTVNDIDSEIGRATIRVGTSFTAGNLFLQPFVSASVFHEFADNVTANFQTCANCVFLVFPN